MTWPDNGALQTTEVAQTHLHRTLGQSKTGWLDKMIMQGEIKSCTDAAAPDRRPKREKAIESPWWWCMVRAKVLWTLLHQMRAETAHFNYLQWWRGLAICCKRHPRHFAWHENKNGDKDKLQWGRRFATWRTLLWSSHVWIKREATEKNENPFLTRARRNCQMMRLE